MKISLVTVGKTENRDIAGVIAEYSQRINRYVTFDVLEVSDNGKDDSKLVKALEKFDRVFLLDEHGREYRSTEFADFVGKQMNSGVKSVAFVVGGPFGFSDEVRAMATSQKNGGQNTQNRQSGQDKRDGHIALSLMTFPHDLVRAIFVEQLYRAFSILKHEKYHHE